MEDQIIFLGSCPRCGDKGYEKLRGYSHCVGCNYSPEFEEGFYIEYPDSVLAQAESFGLKRKRAVSAKNQLRRDQEAA